MPTRMLSNANTPLIFLTLNLKNIDLESQQEDINHLGKITLRFDELLDCRDKDKPFVYEKQVKKILIFTKRIFEKLKN